MSDPIQYSCGCINQVCETWGVLRSVSKCEGHIAEGGKTGIAHHEEMGAVKNGIVRSLSYIEELREPLKELGFVLPKRKSRRGSHALEIGCGVGVYAKWISNHGYDYLGIEPDAEVCAFAAKQFAKRGIGFQAKTFEELSLRQRFRVILAAHVFEHMEDAPGMMAKALKMLEPDGVLIIVIPNDEDPVNPDHIWTFTPENLKSTLEKVGFREVKMTLRRRIEREQFIYSVCRK